MRDATPPKSQSVPVQIKPFVDVLGVEGTISFLLEFGGAELYLPRNPMGRSRLAKSIGVKKAAELASVSGALPRRIPTAKPWLACTMKSKGLSVAEIARTLHASDVSVRRWIKAGPDISKKSSQQLSLF